jgi:single-stranded-DNA-specific exonuclease
MTASFSPPPTEWMVAPAPDAARAEALAQSLNIPTPLGALLIQRGHDTPDSARLFLRPSLEQLSDPMALAGVTEAVDLIAETIAQERPILVHGDYDVDGQCAAALLTRALRAAGARVIPFVPHRMRDGYDFGPAGVAAASAAGAGLIITCDCGITATAAVELAEAEGIHVVITDHHLPGPDLPAAAAVVDPQRPDDHSDTTYLCGSGVAFKLVQALVPRLGLPANLPLHLLDYVALATVADIVPLTGENRALVRHGLKVLANSRWVGLRALVRSAGLTGAELRAGHLGFILGPRLNAVGRIGEAMDGLRLLVTDDEAVAERLALQLEAVNLDRQALDQRILTEALELVEHETDPDRDFGLVLAGEGWHAGVVGIVASRVVERYGRPSFLVAIEGETGKGSGRSIPGFDLHAALVECGDLLERFGGHRMAAGITIRRSNLGAFRERFAAVARQHLNASDLGPRQRVDLVIDLADATDALERLCRHLEPCGMGNPGPVFGVRNVRVEGTRVVGNGHVKTVLSAAGGRLEAIGFRWADRLPEMGSHAVDVAFKLDRNEYRGRSTLQARLVALAERGAARPAILTAEERNG